MKVLSSIFSRIAGAISLIISTLSFVGVIMIIFDGGFSDPMVIKALAMWLIFLVSGILLLASKHGITHVVACVLMLVVLVFERFVWPGYILSLFQYVIYSLISDFTILVTITQYYEIVLYAMMGCAVAAAVFRIIAIVLYGRDD